ncbi:MAG: hypothetical protein JWN14_626 [Chthonomonadales bacterium]|nr:hypothetical protein [Chthonomonadales bacterium]
MSEHRIDLNYYPYSRYLTEDVFKALCSEHGGISQSLLVGVARYSKHMAIKSLAAQMPGYHRVLLDPNMEVQYHLGGYGMFYEEAMIRLAGEAIERYALMVGSYTMADKIRYATYEELAREREGQVVPLEYLRLFSDQDYVKLNRGRPRPLRRLERDDIVGWIPCQSLFDPEREIYVPAQMLFVGYRVNLERGEVSFSQGFSTGAAAHTSLAKALQSALLEFIEIDALMLQWYTALKAPAVTIDDMTVASLVPELLSGNSRYETVALDLRVLEGVDAHVFGVALMNKKEERPFIVFGAQGHLNPLMAFYRGLMEASAVSFLGTYGALFMPKEYMPSAGHKNYTDLDSNVAFFAAPEEAALKCGIIRSLSGGRSVLSGMKNYATEESGRDTARLVRQLSKFSEYGVYLDITPPEASRQGWKVMRVFLPELVTMCVPGVPYSEHPRILRYGGVCNEYPHPLP